MPKTSAGLLMYRIKDARLELMLVHPGGPYWAKKDLGAWTMPKGEFGPDEEPLAAAKREFAEETGFVPPPDAAFMRLTPRKQPSRKLIHAWAFEGDWDPMLLVSNTFLMEHPPRSGKTIEVPETDRAGWFDIPTAKEKITKGQRGFIEEFEAILARSQDSSSLK